MTRGGLAMDPDPDVGAHHRTVGLVYVRSEELRKRERPKEVEGGWSTP